MGKIAVNSGVNRGASDASHCRTPKKSTTLSRKYVKRPTPVRSVAPMSASERSDLERRQMLAERMNRQASTRATKPIADGSPKKAVAATARPARTAKTAGAPASAARTMMASAPAARPAQAAKTYPSAALSAKDAKDQAVKSALRSVATMEKTEHSEEIQESARIGKIKSKKRGRRVALAVLCSVATVGLLATFIYSNIPDISVKVAAMQTGVEATYPAFIPRGYSLSSVTTSGGSDVIMRFDNTDGDNFTLTEQKSTWDSMALLNNHVKQTNNPGYVTLREQGITIYVYGRNAAWVNGGIFYEISAEKNALSKEQIRNIVVSL